MNRINLTKMRSLVTGTLNLYIPHRSWQIIATWTTILFASNNVLHEKCALLRCYAAIVEISYRCFGTSYQYHLQRSRIQKDPWLLYFAQEAWNHVRASRNYKRLILNRGSTRWLSWLGHCATSQKVASSIPENVIEILQCLNASGRSMFLGPEPRVTILSLSCADCDMACSGRYMDSFTFIKNGLLSLLLLLLFDMDVSCHRPFLPVTSLEPAVIPNTQASSFTLQYFPYYVWCSKYSCLLWWIYRVISWYSFQLLLLILLLFTAINFSLGGQHSLH